MSEAFVKQTQVAIYGDLITWIHPSCRDLTIEELSASTVERLRFLGSCSESGIHLATSIGGGEKGERQLPLLQHPKDWEVLKCRCVELAQKPGSILRRLWGNLKTIETQTKSIPSLAPAALRLRRLIEDDVLPATAQSLSSTTTHSYHECLETFFNVRKSLNTNVPIDLAKIWQLCVEDAKYFLPEDEEIWQNLHGPNRFLKTVIQIEIYEPSFLERAQVKASFDEIIWLFHSRGDSEIHTFHGSEFKDDELQEAIEGYTKLSELYTGLGRVNTKAQSVHNERKEDKGGKHHIQLVEAGKDAAEAFEPAKEPFDFIAAAIHHAIVFPRAKPIGLGRHDQDIAHFLSQLAGFIAFVSPIHDQMTAGGSRAAST